ncbi:putative GMC oxidoreductase [Hypoxylon trugodes]|uniref:putative GMC oxidoreductase n=1 Tax=Hypoxylon trugodes TaxID=326681 RepID=UPI00219AFCEA|nr:putative GMC oxidoreductase [Hypoxylon trugodes]KAI1393421.1 putative GMC oxidoreductase [Hypoxylon trugodes]
MESISFDFVIVGGGLAGLVLAARLSEDSDISVLVLEAGDDQTADPRVNVPGMWSSLVKSEAAFDFKTVPQKELGGREIWFPQGRMIGGSSALNGLNFVPTSKVNVDAWEALGNPGWGWESFSESVKKSYSLPQQDKTGGPIQLFAPEEETEWPRIWRETLTTLGFSVTDDVFSGQLSGGMVILDTVQPATKQRSYVGNAYLEPARSRSNLTIWTKASAEKILFDKSNGTPVVTGVQVQKDDKTQIVKARKEVIISAGAINSPKILELSGIGDSKLLKSLGIDVVVDNPHVGENLQNHPLAVLNFEVRDYLPAGLETLDKLIRQEPDAIAAVTEAYSKQKGPLARSGTNSAAQLPLSDDAQQDLRTFLLHNAGLGAPDTATPAFAKAHEEFVRSAVFGSSPSACYIGVPGFGAIKSDGTGAPPPEGKGKYFTVVVLLAHPLSHGSVHITSSNTDAGLAIDPRYFTHPLDIEVLARHVQFVVSGLARAEPLAGLLKPQSSSSPYAPKGTDIEAVKSYIREKGAAAHHYTGSCAMMPRAMGGVVDHELKVYGCRNLRVCDASAIPIVTRSNPQASVYGLAEHAVGIIRRGLKAGVSGS